MTPDQHSSFLARFKRSGMTRTLIGTVIVLTSLLVALQARAAGLELRPVYGRAPVELVFEGSRSTGRFLVENHGATSVTVEVRPRAGTARNPRLPPGVHATFQDGKARATLAPGATRSVLVRWDLPERHRVWQFFGQVLVQRVDAGGRTPPRAIGIHGRIPLTSGWLFFHLLSWILLAPLLGAAGVVAVALTGLRKPRVLLSIATGALLLELVLAFVAYANFKPWVSRWDGNQGYQFIERARLLPSLGVEYALGVDGLSLGLLLLTVLVVLAAALISARVARRSALYWVVLLILNAGLVGVFSALDLGLWLAFWAVAASAAVLLVAGWSETETRNAAARLAVVLGFATLLVGAAFLYLSKHAGPDYLVDGSLAPRTFSLTELMHVDFVGRGLTLWRRSAVAVVWSAMFVGFGLILALAPLHGWLTSVLERAPSGPAILICAALMDVGAYGLLRLGYGVLPQGTVWAARTVSVIGVVGVYYGGLAGLVQTDLRRFVAYASLGHVGFALLAMGSLTAIGVQGCLTTIFSHGLAVTLLIGTAEVLRRRIGSSDLGRLSGLARRVPRLGVLAAVGFLVSLGMPGSSEFIGELLSIAGALPKQSPWAIAGALGFVFVALAHFRVLGKLLLAEGSEESDPEPLAPLGPREIAALAPAAVLAVVLGLWPRPLLRLSDGAALDYADRVNPPGVLQVVRASASHRARLAALEPAPNLGRRP